MSAREKWEADYRLLKESNPDAYRKAIQYSEGIAITHNLSTKAAAETEIAMVTLAIDLLGLRQSRSAT